jgi:hypothetical protein
LQVTAMDHLRIERLELTLPEAPDEQPAAASNTVP